VKKFFTLFMSLTLLFSLSLSAFANEVDPLPLNTFPVTEEATALINRQQPAIDAYDAIHLRFGIVAPSDPAFPNYPDDYGGAYYDDGYLYICLTENTPQNQKKYLDAVSMPSIVKFEAVNHSYNDLYNLSMDLADEIAPMISTISVDVLNNEVEVGVPGDVSVASLKISDSTRNRGLPISFSQKDRPSTSTELKGGERFWYGSSSRGTITICGTTNGNPSILTAGHCVNIGATYRHLYQGGSIFGTGYYKCYETEHFYDYGIITVSGDGFDETNKVLNNNSYTTITSTAPSTSSLIGTIVCKYGAEANFALAEVTDINCVSTHTDTGKTIYGLVECVFTSGTGEKGDSGGPIYVGHTLYGIYSSDNDPEDGTGASWFLYSPITGVGRDIFTVQTSS